MKDTPPEGEHRTVINNPDHPELDKVVCEMETTEQGNTITTEGSCEFTKKGDT